MVLVAGMRYGCTVVGRSPAGPAGGSGKGWIQQCLPKPSSDARCIQRSVVSVCLYPLTRFLGPSVSIGVDTHGDSSRAVGRGASANEIRKRGIREYYIGRPAPSRQESDPPATVGPSFTTHSGGVSRSAMAKQAVKPAGGRGRSQSYKKR